MVEPKEAGDPVIPRVVFRTEGELLAPLVLSQRYVHKEEVGLGVVLVYVNLIMAVLESCLTVEAEPTTIVPPVHPRRSH